MTSPAQISPTLSQPFEHQPDTDEFIAAAMEWHFSSETGSPFWLERAKTLGFDPRQDVRGWDDLKLFPNVVPELRDVRVKDLVPRGYGADARVLGIYESGGTTGPPKRVVLLQDWLDRSLDWTSHQLDRAGFPRDVNWLVVAPTGPHIFGRIATELPLRRGGVGFTVDLDPRWVRKSIGQGRPEEAERYAEHIVDQVDVLLEQQEVGVLVMTPPLLERLARSDRLVKLVNDKVQAIMWGGAHMDADSRDLFRAEVFPDVIVHGMYGSTLILGGSVERPEPDATGRCVFDSFSPYTTFRLVDPDTGQGSADGDRGQVVMNHISASLLLPNNLERDMATRAEAPPGAPGMSVADVTPLASFENVAVIEGVY